jgi:hypothetical protein
MFGKYRKPKPNVVDDYIKSIRDNNYSAGLKVGTQTAIDELRDIQNYECINLTTKEKEMVMSFLIENNLEFGYNPENGGFYILKKK